MKLINLIEPLAEELAADDDTTQANFFNHFAHKLYVACAADTYHTQQQLCALGDKLNPEAKRLFSDMVDMLKKFDGGYGG